MKKLQLFLFLSWLTALAAWAQPDKIITNDIKEEGKLNYMQPKEYEIGGITVTGARFLDANALINLSGLRVGDKVNIPSDDISRAIRKLWDQGILGDVEISITKMEGSVVYLNIDLKERPRLTRINFNGVKKNEVQTLTDKIGTIKGKIVTDVLLKNTQLAVKKYYIDKGFTNVAVEIEQVTDTIVSNSVMFKVNVEKNHRVKIHAINIEGNEVLNDKKVKKRLKGTKEKHFYNIFVSSKFIKSKFEEDKEKLITYYNSKGYRDARVISDTVYRHAKNTLNLDIKIYEGQKYYFGDITWMGNYIYKDAVLSEILGIKKGDVYDKDYLQKKLNFSQTELDISSLYMDDGYLFFNIEPVEVAIRQDTVDIQIVINEGPQATINRIILNGNTKTSDHVILREIRTKPGAKFSRSDIIRSQREITNLGYFDPEKVDINPIPNQADGTVDIEYNLTEKPSDQIELSGGWGGAFGFIGTLGLVFNNFSVKNIANFKAWRPLPSGDGQRLSLRAQANGRAFQTYSLSFTEPWLGGRRPQSFTVSLSHSINRSIFRNEVIGSLKVYGVTVSLGRRLKWPDDFFTLTNSVSYLYYDLFNFGNTLGFSTGTAQNFNFNTTIARNSIDNPTFPRSGSNISLSLTLTPPYSLFSGKDVSKIPVSERFRLVEYHKWMFDTSWFTQLFGKFVLNTRAHMGFIGSYNPALGIGPFERFLLGGDGLAGFNFLLGTDIIGLRGYRNNSIRPIDNASGGVVYNKFVMELRYPVSLNPTATIFIHTFLEAGNNWGSYADYNPFNLYRSAGVGARIFMPAFGLIGIDWGYGFDPIPGVGGNEGQFHFIIGQQIR
ncbi:MAG TPA: outer membrane protein assembly factor BamA [Microscillaceae bacterium]|jgi:outer membrane protein insertion porin family|nr:outer membrane protein assembly factor BamA [Microscillaceae bacterium]